MIGTLPTAELEDWHTAYDGFREVADNDGKRTWIVGPLPTTNDQHLLFGDSSYSKTLELFTTWCLLDEIFWKTDNGCWLVCLFIGLNTNYKIRKKKLQSVHGLLKLNDDWLITFLFWFVLVLVGWRPLPRLTRVSTMRKGEGKGNGNNVVTAVKCHVWHTVMPHRPE